MEEPGFQLLAFSLQLGCGAAGFAGCGKGPFKAMASAFQASFFRSRILS
jgi:hypothetical protein